MYFHSLSSLIIFLPIFFITYPLIKIKNIELSNLFLLFFSLLFYSFDIPWFLIPLLISSICDYFLSKELIENKKFTNNKRIFYLCLSLLINLGLLITFKYSSLISQTFFDLNKEKITTISGLDKIILPVGISFYTFQTLSFVFDSYRKEILKMPKFHNYLLYVAYFPQLVAGPILRPKDFFNRSSDPLLNNKSGDIKNGLNRICYGLFLKLCLADELARFNDIAFQSDFYSLSTIDAWTMSFGFGLQIYYDFSAYSHMAIGISKIIGLPIKENFNFPYSSLSCTKFWRKWHISLSNWVSDYLYSFLNKKIPLIFFGSIPLLLTWSIMGIWHGASWRFALWGFINGLFILIHRVFKNLNLTFFDFLEFPFLSWLINLLSIMSTWIYFRSTSWDQANNLYFKLFRFDNLDLGLRENYYLMVFIFAISTFIFGHLFKYKEIKKILRNDYFKIFSSAIALSLGLIFINSQRSFIYFQF